MRIRPVLAPLLLTALLATLLIQLPLAIASRATTQEWFDPIIEVRRLLIDHFVRELDGKQIDQMQLEMIDAMIAVVEDPYTAYIPPADEDTFNKDLRGEYVGIGAEVNIVDHYLTIITPMDDSPALEAGVRAGDIVLEIEGASTYDMRLDDCIRALTGQIDTPVAIRVRHLDGEEEEITIVRRQIVTRTVRGIRRAGEAWLYAVDREKGLDYVRIAQFNGSTPDELREVLDELEQDGMKGLILDLRENPGGSLSAAVETADLFLDEGQIVSVRGRDARHQRSWNASDDEPAPDVPMIILINGESASASEIVAGALQGNGRAKVLGTRSFGKGSVQEVRELEFDRGTFKFTSAHYYVPGGRNIHRVPGSAVWGVDPDPGLVLTETPEQALARRRARRDFEIIRPAEDDLPADADEAWVRKNLADEQLAAAVNLLEARLRGEPWGRISDEEPTRVALEEELVTAARNRRRLFADLQANERRIMQLQEIADEAGRPALLPAETDLTDCTLQIRDRSGQLVGSYHIDPASLELALLTVAADPIETNDDRKDEE